MLNNKLLLICTCLYLSATVASAQQLKPGMPSFDISGKELDGMSMVKPKTNAILEDDFDMSENALETKKEKSNTNVLKPAAVQKQASDTLQGAFQEENSAISSQPAPGQAGQLEDQEENNAEPPAPIDPILKQKFISHNTGIRKEADEIEFELRMEEKAVLKDLRLLWSAAVEKSTAIRLAIQKLSNPEEGDKIEKNVIQKMLSPLASAAPIAAMAGGSATTAAGALIGGGMLGTMSSDVDQQYNKAFLRVSDYDLIMLAKEVDELQGELVIAYYEYMHALARLEASEEALKNAHEQYLSAQGTDNFAANTAADAFFREAKQNQLKAKQNFLSTRTILEQITGIDVIVYIEQLHLKQQQEKQENASTENATAKKGQPAVKEELKVQAELNEKN